MQVTRVARAKINLFLHVTGRRDDGYHELESLITFADIGDHLTMRSASQTRMYIDGPFGKNLSPGHDNLVLRAIEMLKPGQGVEVSLQKNLPLASGIGGGSADAAAALRGLGDLFGTVPRASQLLSLGADVPMCYTGVSAVARGLGEQLAPFDGLPPFWFVLVNAGQGVATPDVFRALGALPPMRSPTYPAGFEDVPELAGWLAQTDNDLFRPALHFAPLLEDTLSLLRDQSGCAIARMSGSGATCFGIFAGQSEAMKAAQRIGKLRPDWWVQAAAALHDSADDKL